MITIIVIAHLLIFQSMFVVKNIVLSKKLNINIRGKNKEATVSIINFAITILIAITSLLSNSLHKIFVPLDLFSNTYTDILGVFLLSKNLIISSVALFHMGESWRVGIIENESSELVDSGIFKFSRNPYFLSYIVLFIAYIFLISNLILILSVILSLYSIHKMILKEEKYLEDLHGEKYLDYKKKVPRYLLI